MWCEEVWKGKYRDDRVISEGRERLDWIENGKKSASLIEDDSYAAFELFIDDKGN